MSMNLTYGQMEDLLASSYRVGVYCRLSKEDDDIHKGPSQSIAHQREMIDPENGKYVWDESALKEMPTNPVYYGAIAS